MSKSLSYAMPFSKRNSHEKEFIDNYESFLESSTFTRPQQFLNFALYATRQDIARFMFRAEMFQEVLDIHGSIVECGVLYGQGLMTFAHLSSILEPVNHTRKIIGFDTFEGIPHKHEKDVSAQTENATDVGNMAAHSKEEIMRCVEMFDLNRTGGHLPKVELIQGDVVKTAPDYVAKNPHLIVSLLYLNVDVYEPTRVALQTFLPRMPKGSVIAFGELGHPYAPGETLAVMEEFGLRNLKLVRSPYDSVRCYAKI